MVKLNMGEHSDHFRSVASQRAKVRFLVFELDRLFVILRDAVPLDQFLLRRIPDKWVAGGRVRPDVSQPVIDKRRKREFVENMALSVQPSMSIFHVRSGVLVFELLLPDNLFLLQEYLPHDPEQGIVRMEFLDGELLYAMRVKTHGRFNLCPSPVCNPDEGAAGECADPDHGIDAAPVEFLPYPDVPPEAVATAKRIVRAARLDVGGIEYLETDDGRRVFYDINANSNLRPSVAAAFGFDPFERVVDFLVRQLQN